jgi:hypothetical protein
MRIQTIKVVRAAVRWVQRILEARVPMAESNGLRTRR